jgi:hypothetical protein
MNHDNDAMSQNMNQSEMRSEARRKYPKNQVGAKDEWRALVKHQAEMNEQISLFEKDLKNLRSKELSQAHSNKIQEQIRDKQNDIYIKQNESDLLKIRMDQYKRELMKSKSDKNVLQNALANSYQQTIHDKNKIVSEIKEKNLDDEKRNLEEVKKLQQLQLYKHMEKLHNLHEDFNEDMSRAQEKSQQKHYVQAHDRELYNELMKQNETKQVLKEQNYKNFFKVTAENQKVLSDYHAQNVLSPTIKKNSELNEFIDKGVSYENERKLQDEMTRLKWKFDKNQEVGQTIKEQMSYHDYLKEAAKTDKQERIQESFKQSMNYATYEQIVKEQKKEQQRSYKDFLDKQAHDADERARINGMTKNEKKLNFYDLQAFKDSEHKLYSLVPGFTNSKFSPLTAVYKGNQGQSQTQNIFMQSNNKSKHLE